MTTFQVVALVSFLGLVLVVYGSALFKVVKKLGSKVSAEPAASIAVGLVDELIAVTELRDKLAAEGCREGVEACTTLLRVIVEHQQPAQGGV
jgi:hypothetical protein